MLFWILLYVSLILFFCGIYLAYKVALDAGIEEGSGVTSFVFCVLSIVLLIPLMVVWSGHAGNLSKVYAQHHKVEVYEERVESLEERLNNANYPEKSVVSMDNDTPWATMMNSLAKAESELTKAKNEKAEAIRSIEKTRYGPFSGVITFVGDIEKEVKNDE